MSRKDGKIIKHWPYFRPGQSRRTDPLQVPLRMLDRSTGDRSRLSYVVDIDEPCRILDEAADPDVLRKAVFEKLDAFFKIEWKQWFLVSVQRKLLPQERKHSRGDVIPPKSMVFPCNQSHIEVSYQTVLTGTRADGKDVYKELDMKGEGVVHEGTLCLGGDMDSQSYSHGSDGYDVYRTTQVIVPATDANREKLERLIDGMNNTAKALSVLLHGDGVEKGLDKAPSAFKELSLEAKGAKKK